MSRCTNKATPPQEIEHALGVFCVAVASAKSWLPDLVEHQPWAAHRWPKVSVEDWLQCYSDTARPDGTTPPLLGPTLLAVLDSEDCPTGQSWPPDREFAGWFLARKSEEPLHSGEVWFRKPTVQFFLRAWLPCWALHQATPHQLLIRARADCEDSLDKLLRLDKSCILHDQLRARWHAVVNHSRASVRKRMMKALNGHPKWDLGPRNVRGRLAGLISQVTTACDQRITSTQIAKIFDAVEQATDGALVDTDVPVGAALTKAIQRHRCWPMPTLT